jgi:hypothetical protein
VTNNSTLQLIDSFDRSYHLLAEPNSFVGLLQHMQQQWQGRASSQGMVSLGSQI